MLRMPVVLTAVALLVTPAGASTREVLNEFGFFGEWAADCSRPVAMDNPYRNAYLDERGEPVFSETLGPDLPANTYAIVDARPAKSGKAGLQLSVRLNNDVTQSLLMVRNGDQIRTMMNRRLSDGALLVKDGIVVSIGKATPSLARCGDPRR